MVNDQNSTFIFLEKNTLLFKLFFYLHLSVVMVTITSWFELKKNYILIFFYTINPSPEVPYLALRVVPVIKVFIYFLGKLQRHSLSDFKVNTD